MASRSEQIEFAELGEILKASLREVFDSIFPASSLSSFLSNPEVQQKLQHMRATGSLSTVEWQALFLTPDTQGNSATFDVPLLFNLIREFSDLKQPQPNWMG